MLQLTASGLGDLPGICAMLVPCLAETPVMLVDAPMGAGKTTLIKELCRQLGVTDEVSSPTYSLVNEYLLENGGKVFHFDFYRLNTVEEAYDIGAEDYFFSGHICLAEWPGLIRPLLPDDFLELKITVDGAMRHYHLLKSTR
jgi:tRNA threonylcarbamoyladenosine biosynthesis protein TsaE